MRSNCLILICFLAFIGANGQISKVKVTPNGIEPIVQPIEYISSEQGFIKTEEWINYNYKKASAVLGSSIENKLIRFTGIEKKFASTLSYTYDLEYTIRIEFKDNKYRFSVDQIKSGYQGTFTEIKLSDYYKNNGKIRGAYEEYIDGIEKTLNLINTSIYNYLTGKTEKKDSDW